MFGSYLSLFDKTLLSKSEDESVSLLQLAEEGRTESPISMWFVEECHKKDLYTLI